MNQRSMVAARFALKGVALAAACLWGSQAAALGLGRLTVQSALGETLRAEIDVTSMTAEEAGSLKLRVAPPEAYRSAGVDYNAVLPSAQVEVVRRPDGRSVLRVTSDRAVLEPFVDVIIEATWSSGRLVREYTMLFDPPSARQSASPTTAAVVSPVAPRPAAAPSPAPASASAPAAAPAPTPVAAAPAPAASAARAPARRPAPVEAPRPPSVAAAPAAPASEADSVRVQPGDSLSRIAGRTQRSGVSLDQMLVSLFRANPQAFVADNMNRLRSGSVLSVPSADDAARIAPKEAREVIVAQSNDFAAYRQRLASGVAATPAGEAPSRQDSGKVQAQVEDRKQAGAASPDRLTLSQGGVKASEAKVSKATEARDTKSRLAELSRNVDELKKLQGATAPAAAPAVPPAPAPAPAPVAAAAPPPPPVPAPTVVAAAPPPPPPPVVAAPPPPAPVVAPPPAKASAPAARPAPAPTPTPVEEPGLLDSLLDNSLLLPFAGVLVALLGGLGLYRLRSRRKPAGETSFLESRLQPDSFFGASGGQRVDTREAGASTGNSSSSSMSYSLSQLDAIGDVDPVAEADVYLAYGRDLQAEEILKEAMRSNPERMAIRSKLLEVYAKRRDIKGFELLATQMFSLTHGEGEDWTKAQALGLTIDPDNPLYRPGGAPEGAAPVGVHEPLNAPTQPYTVPVPPPSVQPAPAPSDAGGVDLDLDLSLDGPPVIEAPPTRTETTQAFGTAADFGADDTVDLRLDEVDPKTIPLQPIEPTVAMPPRPKEHGLDFDLGDLSLDTPAAPAPPAAAPALDFGDFGIGGDSTQADLPPDHDPLSRKLELAEEFRQIGDMEGARDLLEEVIAKAEGSLRNKAQGMLDKLG